ncbi:MBL fold metallo-hydrolase [Cerasicoccus fimbriatus]|uniref:MBL fold metallo-hydrolase n=1 Tax=Cerasicoccus fimbriatus TaxID=3014554 RepID=UPI0022B3270B|nr:MBL fold metallo-hydrolase [Cerasicoccus sp. TK19100]
MRPNITASSTALFSTWVFIENFGVLLDAGDGVSASLGQKSRKVRHVFVTHADRDHICGLLQLNQLNARDGIPAIYFPKDCGSFPALKEFFSKFDPQSGVATWTGLQAGESIKLKGELFVEARTSLHVVSGDLCKALDYTICSSRRTLKADYRDLPGKEIAALREANGEEAITEMRTEKLIGYSGDAPELEPKHWEGVRILIHEATFLETETARNSHSNLPQVLRAASQLQLEALILIHFSARYSKEEIDAAILAQAASLSPSFPIYAVYPGEVKTDILASVPLWEPSAPPTT